MVGADLAARAARPPPRPAARDRRRRRGRRRAARVDRRVPLVDDAKMTDARDRARAGRLAGRGAARRDPAACCARCEPARRRRALPVGFAGTSGLRATAGGLDADHRARARCSGCPPATRARSPASCARSPAAAAACCSPSRPPRTCTPGPATPSRSAAPAAGPAHVRVAGVVDLPAADSLFQQVGAPAGAQPQAPPDNVVLLPAAHVRPRRRARARRIARRRSTPRSSHACPAARAPRSRGLGRGAQPRDAARRRGPRRRQPRRGARPGAPGRALRPAAVPVPRRARRGPRRRCSPRRSPAPGADRRRREPRCCARAARRPRQLVRLALAEAALAGGVGVARRPRRARCAIGAAAFGTASFGASTLAARRCGRAARRWPACSIAAGAIALPAWRDARALTVAGQRRAVGRARPARRGGRATGSTSLALAGAGARLLAGLAATATSSCSRPRACRRSRSTGTRCSRRCWPGSAPACSRSGSPSSCSRAAAAPLARALRPLGRRAVADRRGDDGPPARACSPARSRWSRSTVAFAASTAVFNATYQQQAEVDARLTNGADVTVTESPGANVGPRRGGAARAACPACRASSRCSTASPTSAPTCRTSTACGRPRSARAGKLQDAGSRAAAPSSLMDAARRSSRTRVLVSEETVQGLPAPPRRPAAPAPAGRAHQAVHDGAVPLRRRRQGVPDGADATASSWPTPAYVARATGSDAVGTFLVQTDGTSPARSPRAVRARRRHRRPGHRHRRPAPGRRLEPHRRGAGRPDQGRARLRPGARGRGRRASRSRSASTSAGGRSRSRRRSAPTRASSAASSGASRCSSRSAASRSAPWAPPPCRRCSSRS